MMNYSSTPIERVEGWFGTDAERAQIEKYSDQVRKEELIWRIIGLIGVLLSFLVVWALGWRSWIGASFAMLSLLATNSRLFFLMRRTVRDPLLEAQQTSSMPDKVRFMTHLRHSFLGYVVDGGTTWGDLNEQDSTSAKRGFLLEGRYEFAKVLAKFGSSPQSSNKVHDRSLRRLLSRLIGNRKQQTSLDQTKSVLKVLNNDGSDIGRLIDMHEGRLGAAAAQRHLMSLKPAATDAAQWRESLKQIYEQIQAQMVEGNFQHAAAPYQLAKIKRVISTQDSELNINLARMNGEIKEIADMSLLLFNWRNWWWHALMVLMMVLFAVSFFTYR